MCRTSATDKDVPQDVAWTSPYHRTVHFAAIFVNAFYAIRRSIFAISLIGRNVRSLIYGRENASHAHFVRRNKRHAYFLGSWNFQCYWRPPSSHSSRSQANRPQIAVSFLCLNCCICFFRRNVSTIAHIFGVMSSTFFARHIFPHGFP